MRWLRFLYPRHWWERYGDEFLALVEERGLSPHDIFDIARGALDAHINYARGVGRSSHSLFRRLLVVWTSVTGTLVFLGYLVIVFSAGSLSATAITGEGKQEILTLLAGFVGLLFTGAYLSLAVVALGMLQDIRNKLQGN